MVGRGGGGDIWGIRAEEPAEPTQSSQGSEHQVLSRRMFLFIGLMERVKCVDDLISTR